MTGYGFCAVCGGAKEIDWNYVHDTCLTKPRRDSQGHPKEPTRKKVTAR